MKYKEHFSEETLFDYAFNKLEKEEEVRITAHINSCLKCANTVSEWKTLLGTDAAANSGRYYEQNSPSGHLKSRVMRTIKEEARKTPSVIEKSSRKGSSKYVASVASFVALLLLTVGLFQYTPTKDSAFEILHNDEIEEKTIEDAPETNQLALIPLTDTNEIQGDVWVNSLTNEMLLEVNGLSQLDRAEYQLWVVHSDDVVEGEILTIVNGSTRVLYRGMDINELKLIKASVEPLGGSVRPTGPETFIVELAN